MISLVRSFIHGWQNFAIWVFFTFKRTLERVILYAAFASFLTWLSVVFYATFHHVYMPSATLLRPAHFKFRVCPSGVGMCSFPMANITLSEEGRAEVLGRGQQYRIFFELDVPDSGRNREIGMFMIVMRVYDRFGNIVQESSRATVLRYQSNLLQTIQTVSLSPLFLFGFHEQKQLLSVELFNGFWDDLYHPAVGALIEIHSRQLEFYSGQLKFHAVYKGLRYYLFFWPLTSAVIGISFNFFWMSLVSLLSWYKISAQNVHVLEESEKQGLTYQEREERLRVLLKEDEKSEETAEKVAGYIQPFSMSPTCSPAETVGKKSINFKGYGNTHEGVTEPEDIPQKVGLEDNFQLRHRYSFDEIQGIAKSIKKHTSILPKIGIICGSGLGNLADHVTDAETVPYSTISKFPVSTVPGHEGKLVFGMLEGKPVVLMKGRFHYYEGHPMWRVAMPVRVMKALGVTTVILTNAAGGLNPQFKTGDIMIIRDHIDLPGLTGECVLIGKNDEKFGPRFPATINTYDQSLQDLAKQIGQELGYGSILQQGTYVMIGGPTFETVAESRLLRMFGADAVGMSTVPEAVVARHCGLRVFGISLITDMCPQDYNVTQATTHEEVLEVGRKRAKDVQKIVISLVAKMSD